MLADDNHGLGHCEWCLIRIMIGMLLCTKSNNQLRYRLRKCPNNICEYTESELHIVSTRSAVSRV